MLCEQAQRIGGTTIWAHNGGGMEAPVAVAHGVVNAYNVGDGKDADYERYYRFFNCGFRLPARRPAPTGGSTITTASSSRWKAISLTIPGSPAYAPAAPLSPTVR